MQSTGLVAGTRAGIEEQPDVLIVGPAQETPEALLARTGARDTEDAFLALVRDRSPART